MSAPQRKSPYWKFILIWNPLFTLVLQLAFSGIDRFWFRYARSNVIADTVSTTCCVVIWSVVLVERAVRRARKLPPVRHAYGWYIALSILGMFPGLWLGFLAAGKFSALFGRPWETPAFADYRVGILMGLMISTLFILFETVRDSREAQRQAESAKLQAQLSALSAQMNPHLLFNALNTVASLIPSDPAAAEEVTVRLSELYRGVLDASRATTHSLEQELELCRAYLDIEKARFGERLRVSVEVDPSIDPARIEIPVLLLQPLVENAVKHGISSRAAGGEVRLIVSRAGASCSLVVEDDGVGVGSSSSRKGAGTGLENCRSRLALRYGDEASFTIEPRTDSGTRVRITLPALEVPA